MLAVAVAIGQPRLAELEQKAAAAKARGDAAAALHFWEQAETIEPRSARVQDEIGFLLAVMNRRPEALQRFSRALEFDPKFAPAHYHLGVAYWLANDPAEAIPHLQSAAAADPKGLAR